MTNVPMYEVPHGYCVLKSERAREMSDRGLHIPAIGQEAPPKGEVVLIPRVWDLDVPIKPSVGDTVHYKKYAGQEIPLLMSGALKVWRCRTCNERDDMFGLPKLCPRNGDIATGSFGPHEFEEHAPEPETYLVLDLRDVLLVEQGAAATDV